jgi:hypothetical protein
MRTNPEICLCHFVKASGSGRLTRHGKSAAKQGHPRRRTSVFARNGREGSPLVRDEGTGFLPRDFQFGGIQYQHSQDQDGRSVHFLPPESSLNEPSTSAAKIPVLFMAPCQVGGT